MPAATIRLFYESCALPHVRATSAQEAVALIRRDETVCVPTAEIAAQTLMSFGLTHDEALAQIARFAPLPR